MPKVGIDRTSLPIRRPPFAGATKRTLDGSVRAQKALEVARAVTPAVAPAPPPPPPPARWVLGGAIGGYVGGGSNAGPQAAFVVGDGFRNLPVVLELELGVRAPDAVGDQLGL